MTNIPTELLRTFVAVVDLRSFTRAAQSLGVTQPAVSAQVKRLQQVLGGELMDKSAPGVALTPLGENVLAYARRLLAINDQILNLSDAAAAQIIRLGVPGDFAGDALWRALARARSTRPDIHFHLRTGPSDILLRDLREGELDVALTLSDGGPPGEATVHWSEELIWVRAPHARIEPDAPLPLVSHGEKCLVHRQAVDALERAGRTYTLPFVDTCVAGLTSAVAAGLGVMALPRGLAHGAGLAVWDDAPLPHLPAIVCNVCVRAAADEIVSGFARSLADAFLPGRAQAAPRPGDRAAG